MKKLFFVLLAIGLTWQPKVDGMKRVKQTVGKLPSSIFKTNPIAQIKSLRFQSNATQKKLEASIDNLSEENRKSIKDYINTLKKQINKLKKNGFETINIAIEAKANYLRLQPKKFLRTKRMLDEDDKKILHNQAELILLNLHYYLVNQLIKQEYQLVQKYQEIHTIKKSINTIIKSFNYEDKLLNQLAKKLNIGALGIAKEMKESSQQRQREGKLKRSRSYSSLHPTSRALKEGRRKLKRIGEYPGYGKSAMPRSTSLR